jgi:alpha-galactosidase
MVGDKDNGEVSLSNSSGWWDFMFRVPMTGQFGMSSRVFDWNNELLKNADENVGLYKRARHVIMGADVYHLTQQPSHDEPTGWCAIQYVSPDKNQSLVMAYRLGNSDATQVLKLRGLDLARSYRVSVNGTGNAEMSGQILATSGLLIRLDDEWRAAVVELRVVP